MNLKNVIWIFAFVLLAGVLIAGAPSTPSQVDPPDNGLVLYNPVNLTCAGSTDPEADPINISFYEDFHISRNASNDGNWVEGANCGNCQYGYGDGWTNETYIQVDDQQSMQNEKDVVFHSETWILQYRIVEGQQITAGVYIDGGLVAGPYTASAGPLNETIDVSAYDDGQAHTLRFTASQASAGPADYFYFWWAEDTLTLLQNTPATSYNWTTEGGEHHHWSCQACDDNGECSDFVERNFTLLNFTPCTSGSIALNLTHLDEENRSYLGDVTTSVVANVSITNYSFSENYALTGQGNYSFCVEPANNSVIITADVEYTPDSADYSFARQYFINDLNISSDNRQDINLYSLLDDLATAVTFSVTRFATPVSDILLHLQRYDPATGIYSLVSMGETNSFGNEVLYLRLTDAFYRVFAYEDGALVYSTGAEHITDNTYDIELAGSESGQGNTSTSYQNFQGINWNITWNATGTNFVTLTADDPSGATTSMCLRVNRLALNDTSTVYYDCVTTSSATISYEITRLNALYTAQFIAYNNDEWRVIGGILIDLGSDLSDLIGEEGVFLAFIIVGLLAFTALYSPIAAVAMTLFGIILAKVFGLLAISPIAIVGIVVVGVILIINLRR